MANAPILYSLTRREQGNDAERGYSTNYNRNTKSDRRKPLDSDDELMQETAAYGGCVIEVETPLILPKPDLAHQRSYRLHN